MILRLNLGDIDTLFTDNSQHHLILRGVKGTSKGTQGRHAALRLNRTQSQG
jgi:hypothetical protein